jgi:hypothetical protein
MIDNDIVVAAHVNNGGAGKSRDGFKRSRVDVAIHPARLGQDQTESAMATMVATTNRAATAIRVMAASLIKVLIFRSPAQGEDKANGQIGDGDEGQGGISN